VQTIQQEKLVRSKPTRCVKCSITNEMTHPEDADPKTGGWTCSRCGHQARADVRRGFWENDRLPRAVLQPTLMLGK
jgi:transposase